MDLRPKNDLGIFDCALDVDLSQGEHSAGNVHFPDGHNTPPSSVATRP